MTNRPTIHNSLRVYILRFDSVVNDISKQLNNHIVDVERDKIEAWIFKETQSAEPIDLSSQKLSGDGGWFLDEVRDWMNRDQQHMWFLGDSGIGKTVLAWTLVNHLHIVSETSKVLNYYFDYRNKSSVDNFLAHLLRQLSAQSDVLSERIKHLYHTARHSFTGDVLRETLINELKQAEHVFIVIDALDESYSGSNSAGVRDTPCEIVESMKLFPDNVSWLITSRNTMPMLDLAKRSGALARTIQSDREEVRSFLYTSIAESPSSFKELIEANPGLDTRIVDSILGSAKNM